MRTVKILGRVFEITSARFMDSLVCPNCGATECHPQIDKILIRGFKISDEAGDWSQCLICAGYYDPVTLVPRPENERPKNWQEQGWFL